MLEQSEFAHMKVDNEIELCMTDSQEAKSWIEKELVKESISYFIRFSKKGFFRRRSTRCIFCVNALQESKAFKVISKMPKDLKGNVEVLRKQATTDYILED